MGRLAKTTHIELQGRDYSLLLDLNGVVAFEEEMHESFFTFTERTQQPDYQMTFKELRALLYASMIHHQPTTTVQEAGALATPADLQLILNAVQEVIKNASPLRGDDDSSPNLPSRSTGSNSGPSDGKPSDSPIASSGA